MSEDITPFHTRSPHDPAERVPVDALVQQWSAAGTRAFVAEHTARPMDLEDHWTHLALGTRIAADVTAGRWVTVACLLRSGAVAHWDQVGAALDVTGDEAAAGFTSWLTRQATLYRQAGIGLTTAEATELVRLADACGGAR
ncbi:hypothetical protein [Umezawaea sp. Da 62-37]|uniref:hypothetical protein n=1 Tax=Umezawaea sp. Da 62-37 TaxID=3075927 RepID=UPI0028F7001E|nr:hypothetical protein [Umezawaea sp. Da 62-37]WNV83692.1 hypothetical protein RM788_36750 [Umezawaea sp. Da 62-37]